MRLGKPSFITPPRRTSRNSKYRPIYRAAVDAKGAWVPVHFDDLQAAIAFRTAVYYQHEFHLEARRRWLTVFVRTRP